MTQTPKYSKGDTIYWKKNNMVYSMTIEEIAFDRRNWPYEIPVYIALKPNHKYSLYFVREHSIIENPSEYEIMYAKANYMIEYIRGFFEELKLKKQ